MMDDRDAAKLANLLALYVRDCVGEGMTEDGALDTTVREALKDIVDATPQADYYLLSARVLKLVEG